MDTMLPDTYQYTFETLGREQGDRQPDWLRDMRKEALALFSEIGFPTTRDEEWKYTNVSALAKVPFQRLVPDGEEDSASLATVIDAIYPDLQASKLVFVDGRFSAALSDGASDVDGLSVESLAGTLASAPDRVVPHLGQSVAFRKNAFTALNTALFEDGALVSVDAECILAQPIHLVFIATARQADTMSHVRNLILAGKNSQATVLESYVSLGDQSTLTNVVTELAAEEGAKLHHYKNQREHGGAYHVATTGVHQCAHSQVSLVSVSTGSLLARHDIHVTLDGQEAECSLNGLYMGKSSQHVDFHTRIVHASPHTRSRELFKGVLTDKARGVFNGAIMVPRDAQKVDSQMTNNNLLLSRDAEIDTKPELEIYADDVKCAHGATIGQLDETAIFYLRTRGIGRNEARGILTEAFALELLESIGNDVVRHEIDRQVLAWLPHEESQGS